MAGHSKWANIKHRKSAQDAKRGKIFTKLIREITVSAKIGGGDAASNPRLRTAIDKALGQNMTRDTIDRAIKRGVGGGDDQNLEEIRYEGYGPNGVAVIVDCLTDNRNRTVSDVRHAFTKMGGNLGTTGSVAFNFNKYGQIYFSSKMDEDTLMEVAIDAGAEDVVRQEDGSFIINTAPESLNVVVDQMIAKGLKPEDSEINMVPMVTVALDDLEDAQTFMKMIDMLEDLDDVQDVYSNAEISEAIGKQL
ncbi:YebC/PmpR family DNA-binding transcriptional regulator [Candidatus Berkiella cookevillensis]|uniref:Probable transcriptional regulatory protein CC99x_01124 n=1 Tax=Candidatus Berkiella cookevillensis TaxID=437022 RepID=A0A0Q9YF66_9GAMM|nr:YebC/PmpR family DNA-binding transcriptional regulator [Candidatus Berkiella cookevillensis]MCS5709474.1 YebC/PmpR family DNA-binding transcriptional regulator [Candidatus Berkiella cookevillensis]